ncbi:MAG: carboxypeptidase-like regulatory domain-containing protein [Acidobacteriota bacterium]|nr:carboxypeptidase-like regulatory domain-containing protein [Acidobacteriota bacterium]
MRANTKIRKLTLGTFIIATAFLTTIAVYAATVIVTPGNLQGWQISLVDDDADGVLTATVNFVNGPGTPPLGTGSVQLSVGSEGADAAQLVHSGYGGTFVRDFTALSYSTYVQQSGSGGQAPYILLDVDYNNDGTRDDILFFEPAYQNATFCPSNPQPAIAVGAWQTWNALNGCWWSLFNFAGTFPGTGVKPLSAILDVEPDARISTNTRGVRIVAGFGEGAWNNFIGNVDAFTIGVNGNETTYNFEPSQTTASSVSVSGRIMSGRRVISNARVFLTNQNGETKTALTNSFGYYRFGDVQAGGTYVLNVSSKRYNFSPQVITINEEMSDLNFIAQP